MEPVKPFNTPKQVFGDLEPDEVASLIATSADISLVLDASGVIRDLACANDDVSPEGAGQWIGRPWVDTVTLESRAKVEALLQEAGAPSKRWRQVNHPTSRGPDVPVMYAAMQVGGEGRVVAFGRDLRGVADLQRRLVDAQQVMEREYARMRQAETRYRLLFQVSSEAVLVLDAASQKVLEANPAAAELLGLAPERLSGRSFPAEFPFADVRPLQDALATVRATGHAATVQMVLQGKALEVSASLFRQDNVSHFLVRLHCPQAAALDAVGPQLLSPLLGLVQQAPDGFVVTDPEGRILAVNPAFLELIQMAAEDQVLGMSLGRWLGRPGVDLGLLLGRLREHDSLRLFQTGLRGEYGSRTEVEISGVAVTGVEPSCMGFTIRDVGARLPHDGLFTREGPRTEEQLTELVGRVPLKELVRESTDMIERLCIEAALELTQNNRASAAEMLGLSRQSFYVKLRRYGLGDPAPEDGG